MNFIRGLKCRECGREYPEEPIYVCEWCFGSLEVIYDYEEIKKTIKREIIEKRNKNLWRYIELLPLRENP
ncbi:MAG: threonine synthase, partial [Candidatus Ratteibacteria bacterium]